MDQDVAIENAFQRLLAQIALLAVIGLRIQPHLAVDREIAHAGRRHPATAAIDALGVLPARHLHPVRRAGELHPLHGARGYVLERDRAPTGKIGGAGQDLERGNAAIGERAGEAGILRPDRMFGPDLGRHRAGRLVPVRMRVHAGRGIIAEMRMDVDHAGRDELARPVDPVISRGRERGIADRDHLAVAEQDGAVVDPLPAPVIDRRADEGGRATGVGLVGGSVGCLAIRRHGRAGRSRIAIVSGRAAPGKRGSGNQPQRGERRLQISGHETPFP